MEKTGAEPADVRRLRQRDREAFRAVYEATKAGLYNFILYKLNGATGAAEDVLSEVFCSAIDYAPGLAAVRNVKAWLYRIARNKIVDYIRRSRRERKIESGVPAETADDPRAVSPEDEFLGRERDALFQAAFQGLDGDYRRVLTEKYAHGLSVEKIAAGMSKTAKAVESLLFRGRRILAESVSRLEKEKRFSAGRRVEA
ncbi:MAG: RNA polymerase sigma factor [Spirochaetales bacterium]|nr:RNA polymerase sigma factor [Spirochaetales bacterium]